MATAFKLPEPPVLPRAVDRPAPLAIISPDQVGDQGSDPYAALRRRAPAVGALGMHPQSYGLCGAAYGAMLLAFWAGFATDGPIGLILAIVTFFMLVYFSLVLGGLTFADSPVPGTLRSFGDFLTGRVETASGPVSGREALVVIAGLPLLLALMATAIGFIARIMLAN